MGGLTPQLHRGAGTAPRVSRRAPDWSWPDTFGTIGDWSPGRTTGRAGGRPCSRLPAIFSAGMHGTAESSPPVALRGVAAYSSLSLVAGAACSCLAGSSPDNRRSGRGRAAPRGFFLGGASSSGPGFWLGPDDWPAPRPIAMVLPRRRLQVRRFAATAVQSSASSAAAVWEQPILAFAG